MDIDSKLVWSKVFAIERIAQKFYSSSSSDKNLDYGSCLIAATHLYLSLENQKINLEKC